MSQPDQRPVNFGCAHELSFFTGGSHSNSEVQGSMRKLGRRRALRPVLKNVAGLWNLWKLLKTREGGVLMSRAEMVGGKSLRVYATPGSARVGAIHPTGKLEVRDARRPVSKPLCCKTCKGRGCIGRC